MLSPAAPSPFVPSSKNRCASAPPIEVRLPLTARSALVGFEPGVTVTVSRTTFPAATGFELAAPTPDGLVVAPQGAIVAVLRGPAGPATKSDELLSVSIQPPLLRTAAVVAPIVGVGPAPSKQFAPLP